MGFRRRCERKSPMFFDVRKIGFWGCEEERRKGWIKRYSGLAVGSEMFRTCTVSKGLKDDFARGKTDNVQL